jgi:hypothetical protein
MKNLLSDTGMVSTIMYGILILVSIISVIVATYQIKENKIDLAKLDKIIGLYKYTIVSIAIATTTLIISDLFKERQQDVKELEYFDKYVDDVKKADGIIERLQLTKYLSIVAPSGELKNSWNKYYDSVKIEYQVYLEAKTTNAKLDTVKNLTQTEITKRDNNQKIIDLGNKPIANFDITSTKNLTEAQKWEEKGFNDLINRDVENAINAFTFSENSYNGFHSVYDIAKYLKDNRAGLLDKNSNKWLKTYETIGRSFSYGMPSNTKDLILNLSK